MGIDIDTTTFKQQLRPNSNWREVDPIAQTTAAIYTVSEDHVTLLYGNENACIYASK